MKAFICLFSSVIIFVNASLSQNKYIENLPETFVQGNKVNSGLKFDCTFKNSDTRHYYYHISYGLALNEVLFNKYYHKSFASAISHEFGTGSAFIFPGKKLIAEFQFDLFYQFSKQKSSNENGFKMEYNGFGMKAPKISLLYNFGNLGLGMYYPIPYDYSWFKFNIKNYPVSFSGNEKGFLENYNEKFKFSSAREFGIGLKAGNNFNLNFGYECRLFYPAYKFLQQQAGALMELSVYSICYSILAAFMSGGASLNPVLAAFIFLIPEAASFTVTQLRKKSVNWPFKSDSPLYYNSFKLNLNFVF